MSYRRKGVGDWFEPACSPGAPGCVPHWYCYIPAMATPDCFASFVQGVREIGGAAGTAVGSTVGAAVEGAAGGAVAGFLPTSGDAGGFWQTYGNWLLLAALGVAAFMFLPVLQGRR